MDSIDQDEKQLQVQTYTPCPPVFMDKVRVQHTPMQKSISGHRVPS